MENSIEIRNLKKYFGKIKAVDDITLSVKTGEIMGFLGPNGAGKTTTIKTLMNYLFPDAGEVKVLGLDSVKDAVQIKSKLGYLSSEPFFYNSWTGQEHIDLVKSLRRNKLSPKFNEKELVEKLLFDPTRKVKDLSTGNKQKLGIILTLMHKPEIIVLDELTLGLDPLLQKTIYAVLLDVVKNGSTVFLSSHNLAEVENICDRASIIKEGKIITTEGMSELKNKKIYTIRVHFTKDIPARAFMVKNAELVTKHNFGYTVDVKGDLNVILRKIAKYQIKDIEIQHASLEEIFLEYYR